MAQIRWLLACDYTLLVLCTVLCTPTFKISFGAGHINNNIELHRNSQEDVSNDASVFIVHQKE